MSETGDIQSALPLGKLLVNREGNCLCRPEDFFTASIWGTTVLPCDPPTINAALYRIQRQKSLSCIYCKQSVLLWPRQRHNSGLDVYSFIQRISCECFHINSFTAHLILRKQTTYCISHSRFHGNSTEICQFYFEEAQKVSHCLQLIVT